ncbi:kinase-like protein [Ramaria rubella]|nr:kinase-like protein [Ramaria rubella]
MTHEESPVVQLLADVAHGLAHVHSCGIIYGILSPSTVLVSTTGRAHLSTDHPEDLATDDSGGIITTFESDVFEFGTTIMEVLSRCNFSDDVYALRNSYIIKRGLEDDPEWPRPLKGPTHPIWNVVRSCQHPDPRERPTMAAVAQRMSQLSPYKAAYTPTHQETRTPPPAFQSLQGPNASHVVPSGHFVADQREDSPHTLRNVSAEIRRVSEHPIAGGGFCDLFLGEKRDSGERVALKLVRFYGRTEQEQQGAQRRFLSEAGLWADFQHPRILQFYGVCQHGDRAFFMVSPFLQNGNAVDYLTNVNPDANRRQLLLEAAEGLLYLHSRNPSVVHGDMKGANILITDYGAAVVADFGLSKINHEATTTMLKGAGSPRWMAPELFAPGDGPSRTTMSDVYAFGHVMLEIYSNQLPFFDVREDIQVLFALIRGERSPRPHGTLADRWIDDETWEFTRKCTAINPEERPDMTNVVLDLGHQSRNAERRV